MRWNEEAKKGFCIYINTICDGPTPIQRDEKGSPFVYATLIEAQREIADDTMERLRQFMEGERDFDDAITVEEYMVKVDVFPDGSVLDADGNKFGKDWY